MKRLLMTVLLLVLASGEGLAITRRDVGNMTCEQIESLLREEGKAILRFPSRTGDGPGRFGIYVSEEAFCPAPDIPVRRRMRSATGDTCFITTCSEPGRSLRR